MRFNGLARSRGDVIMPDHLPPRIAGLAGQVPTARGEGTPFAGRTGDDSGHAGRVRRKPDNRGKEARNQPQNADPTNSEPWKQRADNSSQTVILPQTTSKRQRVPRFVNLSVGIPSYSAFRSQTVVQGPSSRPLTAGSWCGWGAVERTCSLFVRSGQI